MTEIKHSKADWDQARKSAKAAVKARLDLFKVCEALGAEMRLNKSSREPRAGDRVFSPMRDDGKSPGLLLVGDAGNGRSGRVVGAKDMSTRETFDIFSFTVAVSGKDFKEAAEWLYGLAGVRVEDYLPLADGSAKPAKQQAPESETARRKRMRKLSDAAYAKFAEPMARVPVLPEMQQASAWIAAAWKAGRQNVGNRIQKLATSRGWPVEWAQALYDMGDLSWPELPWSTVRCVAFRVRYPDALRGSWMTLGYHQRVVTKDSKFWVYCPYVPDVEKLRTEYQQTMRRAGQRIPALPFVLGNPWQASKWIIAEGQWDILTAWGLIGGFEAVPDGVCVLGLRGAGSVEPLLAAYEPFWQATPPVGVVVFRDNDKAGSVLAAWQPTGHNDAPKMTFDDRLRAIVAEGDVKVLHPAREGWDLNDLYKNRLDLHKKIKGEIESTWI